MNLSSPNRMIWMYGEALRRVVRRALEIGEGSIQKQEIVISVLLAMATIEAFLNVFFRVLVSEKPGTLREQRVVEDLARRRTLDHRIRKWPSDVLGQAIDFRHGVGKAFMCLKAKRNALMHFTSSHSTLEHAGSVMKGLADTSVFDHLVPDDAVFALGTAEGMIEKILQLSGTSDAQLPRAMHLWTGKVAPTH